MKDIVLLIACLCGSDPKPVLRVPSQPVAQQRSQDRWFGPDKVKHFLMTAFIQSASFSAGRAAGASRSNAQLIGGVSSAAFGIGKEVQDRRNAKPFSLRDLVWDASGALTAASLLNGTR